MKAVILFLNFCLAYSVPTFGYDKCRIKQKNAASFNLAQELVLPVQDIKIMKFNPGFWTQGMSNNVGSDQVSLAIGESSTWFTYGVSAQQIDGTDECRILEVVKVKP